jgi:hypothetical protein
MAEKRARDLKIGDKMREFGDLSDEFNEIVNVDHRGDDVLVDVVPPGEVRPVSIPVLDGDEVVEVVEQCGACGAIEGTPEYDNHHDSQNCWADYKVSSESDDGRVIR